jgi:uncharacterized protein YjcR
MQMFKFNGAAVLNLNATPHPPARLASGMNAATAKIETAPEMDAPVRVPFLPNGAPPQDARRTARSLYWRHWAVTDIAEELGLKRSTVQSWKDRDKWDEAPMIRQIEDSIAVRFHVLIAKDKKSGTDFKEIDLLGRQLTTLARIRKYNEASGHEGDLNEKISNRNAGPKKKAKKNHFDEAACIKLRDIFEEQLFEYQLDWMNSSSLRTRWILKSRQIGATWYFAREALLDAVETGRNQIWLSASKAQAHIARQYMIQFAAEAGVTLTGDPIVITSDLIDEGEPPAELHFLGTNAKTAQGYHGNFIFDEFFWTHNFEELNKVASGMAMHKKWRKTYMSAPSSIAHPAYGYWSGQRRNRNRKKEDQITIDTSHAALKKGAVGPDRIWRQIVTIEDAEAGGCNLFDIEELRDEYAPDEFANLLMCQFVDDSQSAFKFNELTRCLCDSWIEWEGFEPLGPRPVGAQSVWAGYDPQESEDGDNAALTIALPPKKPGGEFRIIERHQLRGLDFEQQSEFIRAVFTKYNVTYFGVDATGVGAGVFQLVRKWFPRVTEIEYSLEVKARLVMKAQNIVRTGRLKFDAGWTDVVMAFMAIKKTLTPKGGQLTYKAGRSKDGGHSDLAWSIMHILDNEPLEGGSKQSGTAIIFGDDE